MMRTTDSSSGIAPVHLQGRTTLQMHQLVLCRPVDGTSWPLQLLLVQLVCLDTRFSTSQGETTERAISRERAPAKECEQSAVLCLSVWSVVQSRELLSQLCSAQLLDEMLS